MFQSVIRNLLALASCIWLCSAAAQVFPSKPIRIVVGGVGGANDIAARMVAPSLSSSLGQPVVVENRSGAGGALMAQAVLNAPADGHTFLLYSGAFWQAPLIQPMPYDAVRDFAPIVELTQSPLVLVVHPSLPVRSVRDLIALAKSRPGVINYATGGLGSSSHLAAELFKSMTQSDFVRVNYRNVGASITALTSGEAHFLFTSTSSAMPSVRAGRLRALAVTTAKQSTLYPELPTVASIVPGYECVSILAAFALAKTPSAIVNRLNEEFVRALRTAELREKFQATGAEVVASTPHELAVVMTADIARLQKLIKETGLRMEF